MTNKTVFEDVTAYWDDRARHFNGAASHVRHEGDWVRVLSAAFETAGPLDVIDLGTGTGACAIVAAGLGHRVTAVDGSAQMLAQAKSVADARSLEIAFLLGSLEDLHVPRGSYDVVTIRNVLWTLADPLAVIRTARTLLRANGRVVIADGLWSHAPRHRSTYPEHLVGNLPYHAGLTEQDCHSLLDIAGFHDRRSWHHLFSENPYRGDIPHFVISAQRCTG